MKVLMTGPNINDDNKLGGIISFIKIYLENFSGDADYFARSASSRSFSFFIKFIFKLKAALQTTSYDFIHINTALNLPSIIRDVVISSLIPGRLKKVIHIHGGKYLNNRPNLFINSLIKKLVNGNNVIVLSEAEKESISRTYKPKKILVLRNAVNIPFQDVNEDARLIVEEIESPMTISYVGRIDEYKGLEYLFETLCKCQEKSVNFKFSLYGDGPSRSIYVEKYSSRFQESFFYGGIVHGKDKTNAFLNSQVFILPSLFEGLPMALLEAMALGRVVIATRVGSIPGVITDKVNGFLVSPANSDELFKALTNLPDFNAKKISNNALKTIAEEYNSKSLDTSVMKIYDEA